MRRRKVKAMQVGKGKAAGFLEEEVGAWSVEHGACSVMVVPSGMDGDKLAQEFSSTGLLRLQRGGTWPARYRPRHLCRVLLGPPGPPPKPQLP